MPGARWDTLSGALNFSVLLLISFILIGPKPSLAFLSEEPAWSKSLQSTRCEAGRALPDNVHAYLEFAHPCLENLPAGMQLLKGDMFANTWGGRARASICFANIITTATIFIFVKPHHTILMEEVISVPSFFI